MDKNKAGTTELEEWNLVAKYLMLMNGKNFKETGYNGDYYWFTP